MMGESITSAKPLAIPGPIAFVSYFSCIAVVVGLHLAVKKYRLLPTVLIGSMVLLGLAVVGVPTAVLVIRWRGRCSKKDDDYHQRQENSLRRDPLNFSWLPSPITTGAFVALGVFVYTVMRMLDEPSIWHLAVVLQSVAYAPLLLKVVAARNVSTISAKKLALDAVWLLFRLVATNMLDKKLPRKSGSSSIMVVDAISLTFVVVLLVSTLVWRRATYQATADSFRIWPVLLGALLVAATPLRASIGQRFVPDVLWTASLYVDVASMLPQLWMIGQHGGIVDEAVRHHIATTFMSRAFGLAFWWSSRGQWMQGTRFTGWLILVAYVVHLLLLSQFMCYYLKALCTQGLFSRAPLVCAES